MFSQTGANAPAVKGANGHWFEFLSRWSLLSGVVYVGLFLAMMLWMGASGDSSTLAPEYAELYGAITTGALYRVAIVFDAAAWLCLAIFFTTFAYALANRAPVRAAILAVCGFGQIAGLLGAFARLEGTTRLASQYLTAAQTQQNAVLQSFQDLQLTINSHFGAGALLWSLGLILVASVLWSKSDLPRWLSSLMMLNGLLGLLDLGVFVATGEYLPFEFSMARVLVMLPIIFFALAWTLKRRAPASNPQFITTSKPVDLHA